MIDKLDLDQSIEKLEGELREREWKSFTAGDPLVRKPLREEVEDLQRKLFRLRKDRDELGTLARADHNPNLALVDAGAVARASSSASATVRRGISTVARCDHALMAASVEDRVWVDRFRACVEPIPDTMSIELWDDSPTVLDSNWRPLLESSIQQARAAVLFLSIDFFASDMLAEEELPLILERARAGHLTLLQIFVSSCTNRWLKSGLVEFAALNSPLVPLDSLEERDQNATLRTAATLLKRYLADVEQSR